MSIIDYSYQSLERFYHKPFQSCHTLHKSRYASIESPPQWTGLIKNILNEASKLLYEAPCFEQFENNRILVEERSFNAENDRVAEIFLSHVKKGLHNYFHFLCSDWQLTASVYRDDFAKRLAKFSYEVKKTDLIRAKLQLYGHAEIAPKVLDLDLCSRVIQWFLSHHQFSEIRVQKIEVPNHAFPSIPCTKGLLLFGSPAEMMLFTLKIENDIKPKSLKEIAACYIANNKEKCLKKYMDKYFLLPPELKELVQEKELLKSFKKLPPRTFI